MRILFVSSEVFPLAKTGGLADVSASLPRALQALGHQVSVLMPAYRGVLATAQPRRPQRSLSSPWLRLGMSGSSGAAGRAG